MSALSPRLPTLALCFCLSVGCENTATPTTAPAPEQEAPAAAPVSEVTAQTIAPAGPAAASAMAPGVEQARVAATTRGTLGEGIEIELTENPETPQPGVRAKVVLGAAGTLQFEPGDLVGLDAAGAERFRLSPQRIALQETPEELRIEGIYGPRTALLLRERATGGVIRILRLSQPLALPPEVATLVMQERLTHDPELRFSAGDPSGSQLRTGDALSLRDRNGAVRLHLPAPSAWDAGELEIPWMQQSLEGRGPGEASLETQLPVAWLAAAHRRYPVDIDPSVVPGPPAPVIAALSVDPVVPGSAQARVALVYSNGVHSTLEVAINWGDGAELLRLDNRPLHVFHSYDAPGEYEVQIQICTLATPALCARRSVSVTTGTGPGVVAEGAVCRPAAGPCDVEERLDPAGRCPEDLLRQAGTVCREAGAEALCDPAESCDGQNADCPQDVKVGCDPGQECDPADGACKAASDCDPNPCQNGGICSDSPGGFSCDCAGTGFEGDTCQNNVDDCDPDPCLNGGACADGVNAFTCDCDGTGFDGDTCQNNIDDCDPDPCLNGGSCIDGVNAFTCDCTGTGFEGDTCADNVDDCAAGPCQNGGSCTDGVNAFTCDCTGTGFEGATCQSNIDDCAAAPCQNGGACVDGVNAFTCNCDGTGFEGDTCGDNVDDCESTPCQNGGVCTDGVNAFTCNCDGTGFEGDTCADEIDNCEPNPCANAGVCSETVDGFACDCSGTGFEGSTCEENIDDCAANPCQNDGVCVDGVNAYTCDCTGTGFEGDNCELDADFCDPNPCGNGGVCSDTGDSFSCDCSGTGYEGTTCDENVDDCNPNPCQNGSGCLDQINGFVCLCTAGYEGDTCDADIDDCDPNRCENGGVCTDGLDSFSCDCSGTGFEDELCTTNIDDCDPDPCANGGVCSDGVNSFSCDCTGTGFEGDTCADNVDDCDPNPCNNGGACSDGVNSFSCDCTGTGFEGDTCADNVDDCASNPCDNGGVCTDGVNSFTCDCSGTGFEGDTCADNFDDCDPNPCGNGGACTDGVNDFSCDCTDTGFEGETCQTELDECDPNPCLNGGACTDGVNSFTCDCPAGTGGDICEDNVDDCDPNPCENDGVCTDAVDGFSCDCGLFRRGTTCQAVVSCKNAPCENGGSCTSFSSPTFPRFECDCTGTGFEGDTCADNVDDCASNPCENGGVCTDAVNDFTCDCTGTGFEGDICATSVDDCPAVDPCQNGGSCVDGLNGFSCDCAGTGFKGDTCEQIDDGCPIGDVDGDGSCDVPDLCGCDAACYSVDTFVEAEDRHPGDGSCFDRNTDCSLTAALEEIEGLDAGTVVLPAGTFDLSAEIAVSGSRYRIVGQGADSTLLSGANLRFSGDAEVELVDLAFINTASGVAVHCDGCRSLSFEGVRFADNSVGAVLLESSNDSLALEIAESEIRGNSGAVGGTVSIRSTDDSLVQVRIRDSLFVDNVNADGEGGALHLSSLADTSVASSSKVDLEIRRSAFLRNRGDFGGALFLDVDHADATLLVESSLFHENSGSGGIRAEGGVFALTVRHCTISDEVVGYGIDARGDGATTTLQNSVLSNNFNNSGSFLDVFMIRGTLVSGGGNVLHYGQANGSFPALDSDQLGSTDAPINPLLQTLVEPSEGLPYRRLGVASPARGAGVAFEGLDQLGADLDPDGDGAPDAGALALCDTVDSDLDGLGDSCDGCPKQNGPRDFDGDGSCNVDDFCEYDSGDDADGNGICADVDLCCALPSLSLPGTVSFEALSAQIPFPTDADSQSGATLAYQWFRDGALFSEDASIPADTVQVGELWSVTVSASFPGFRDACEVDGQASLSIGNAPPSCSALSFSPAVPLASDDVLCACVDFFDPEGASDQSTCRWERPDGTLLQDGSCTLPGGIIGRGNTVSCTLTPFDGAVEGAPVVGDIEAGNSAPTTLSAEIDGPGNDNAISLRTAGGTITCDSSIGTVDADGDVLTYDFEWLVEGTAVLAGTTAAGELPTTTLNALYAQDAAPDYAFGQAIACRLRATDGDLTTSLVDSDNQLTTEDAAPGGSVTLESVPLGETFHCDSQISDADGDDVTQTYVWSQTESDGTVTVFSEFGDMLDADLVSRTATLKCSVTATSSGGTTVRSATSRVLNRTVTIFSIDIESSTGNSSYGADYTCKTDSYQDLDGDVVQALHFTWRVNGTVVREAVQDCGGTNVAVNCDDPDTLTAAEAGYLPGDVLSCEVSADDGLALGNAITAERTVENLTPVCNEALSLSRGYDQSDTAVCGCADLGDRGEDDLPSQPVRCTWHTHAGELIVQDLCELSLAGRADGFAFTCSVRVRDFYDIGNTITTSGRLGGDLSLSGGELEISPVNANGSDDQSFTCSWTQAPSASGGGGVVVESFSWIVEQEDGSEEVFATVDGFDGEASIVPGEIIPDAFGGGDKVSCCAVYSLDSETTIEKCAETAPIQSTPGATGTIEAFWGVRQVASDDTECTLSIDDVDDTEELRIDVELSTTGLDGPYVVVDSQELGDVASGTAVFDDATLGLDQATEGDWYVRCVGYVDEGAGYVPLDTTVPSEIILAFSMEPPVGVTLVPSPPNLCENTVCSVTLPADPRGPYRRLMQTFFNRPLNAKENTRGTILTFVQVPEGVDTTFEVPLGSGYTFEVGSNAFCSTFVRAGQSGALTSGSSLEVDSERVVVVDSSPSVNGIEISSGVVAGDLMRCTYESVTPGCAGEPVVTQRWYVDGTLQNGENAETFSTAGLDGGEAIQCAFHVSDASGGDGAETLSEEVTLGSATWRIYHDDEAIRLGTSVDVIDDLDGDGRAEVVVGAPNSEFSGGGGVNYATQGAMVVALGRSDEAETRFRDVLDGDRGLGLVGNVGGDRFGNRVRALGDIDGDGVGELLVLAPSEDASEGTNSGRVYYYASSVLQELLNGPAWWASTFDSNRIDGPQENGYQGESDGFSGGLATGDFDGDGIEDVALGVPYFSGDDGTSGDGRTYVVDGNTLPGGTAVRLATAEVQRVIDGRRASFLPFVVSGEAGGLLVAGEATGDGIDELWVSSTGSGYNRNWLIYGDADGGDLDLDAVSTDHMLTTTSDLTFGDFVQDEGVELLESGRWFFQQEPVVVPDVNGDGVGDLVVPSFEIENGEPQAEIAVIFGSGDIDDDSIGNADAGQGGFVIEGRPSEGTISTVMQTWALGDVDGDGLGDIGLTFKTSSEDSDPMHFYVVYGRADTTPIDLVDLETDASIGFRFDVGETSEEDADIAVDEVAHGDVNGDGLSDFVYGISEAGVVRRQGEVVVRFGRDFRELMTHTGSDEDDVLSGSVAVDHMLGGLGDDLLEGLGGADVLYGGGGNDELRVDDASFLRVDGGAGTDTFVMEGGFELDLEVVGTRLREVEVLRMGDGAHQLTTGTVGVLRMSRLSNTLQIFGDADDTVVLEGDAWAQQDAPGGDIDRVFTSGNARVELGVDVAVSIPPAFTTQVFSVPEFTSDDTVVAEDFVTDADGSIVSLEVTGQPVDFPFRFDAATRTLLVDDASSLDFETQSSYEVELTATDNDGLSTTVRVTIEIEDVNEAPVFDEDTLTISVREVVDTGRSYAVLSASDPDNDAELSYSIDSGTGAAHFGIDASSGLLSVTDGYDIAFETGTLALQVSVSDGELSDTAQISIEIIEVPDDELLDTDGLLPCGGANQRACCSDYNEVSEIGSECDSGLIQLEGCGGNCDCGGDADPDSDPGAVATTTCIEASPCGGIGQRACCVAESLEPCADGLTEVFGCLGDCWCGASLTGVVDSTLGVSLSMCADLSESIDEPEVSWTPSSDGRACPMYGYADTHLHLFAHLAHGGAVLAGEPYDEDHGINGALKQCFGTDVAMENSDGTARTLDPSIGDDFGGCASASDSVIPVGSNCPAEFPDCGEYKLHGCHGVSDDPVGSFIGTGDSALSGFAAPIFSSWPAWRTTTHQQSYWTWLERAWLGGLRLITMLGVTNEAMCRGNARKAQTECTDSMTPIDEQLAAAYEFQDYVDGIYGGEGQGWFRIVLTPEEAREAITEGKMAVVLGIEVDNLFNCKFPVEEVDVTLGRVTSELNFTVNSGCTEDFVLSELDRYYDMGVRHIFPIHNFNNAFGGPATWQDTIEVGNRIVEGTWWEDRDCSDEDYGFALGGGLQAFIGLYKFGDEVSSDEVEALLFDREWDIQEGDGVVELFQAWLEAAENPPERASCNAYGLFPLGESLIEGMMDKGMLIDIDHMSNIALDETIELARNYDRDGDGQADPYPLTATHALFFDLYEQDRRHERLRTREQLVELEALGGVVAPMLKDDHLDTDARGQDLALDWEGTELVDDCRHSAMTFAQSYLYAIDVMDGKIALGSDFNGIAGHFGPRFGNEACGSDPAERSRQLRAGNYLEYPFVLEGFGTFERQVTGQRTFDYNYDGMAHVGLLPDFVAELSTLGVTDDELEPLWLSAQSYIQMWERARGEQVLDGCNPCAADPDQFDMDGDGVCDDDDVCYGQDDALDLNGDGDCTND